MNQKKTRTSISVDIKKEICQYMLANPNIKMVLLHYTLMKSMMVIILIKQP